MKSEYIPLIKYRLERAHESIEEAELLLNNNHYNTCVNRLYYGCFYAVSGLLLIENKSSSKHSGIRAFFDQHWIKPGRISIEMGRIYKRLFEKRQQGDYGELVHLNENEVKKLMDEAKLFIKEISTTIQSELDNHSHS